VPIDLRRPLLDIFLAHADGAVRFEKGKWIDFDPLRSAGIAAPFDFELDAAASGAEKEEAGGVLWREMTWPEAERRLQQVDVALLPVGAVEQHGPHLPLDTDTFDAEYLAVRVAEACSEPKPLVMPTVAYGVSYHHQDFTGTLSIGNETLSRMVYEIGMEAARNGIQKLVVINGHGGNGPALNFAAQMINRDARIFVCVDSGETSDVDIYRLITTPNDVHAGEIETSTSLAVRPHLVRMERAVRAVPAFSSRYLDFTSKRGISWYTYTRRISSSGIMGDPTAADAEKGEKIWAIMIAHLVSLVEDLKGMTLEEIHNR
jgi:mycofactocin system creatininase family protein